MCVVVLPLACRPQHYSWGKLGSNSAVAQLLQSNDSEMTIEEERPYAELWMGAHPKADSLILWDQLSDQVQDSASVQTLGSWIQKNPESLGSKVRTRFNDKLPFLFKVLSVRTALSIQAHPHKELAVRLHSSSPEHYPDENHKPEMAVALTPFTGLCGFRPVQELLDLLSEVPELQVLLGPDSVQSLKSGLADLEQTRAALKSCFTRMMKSSKDLVQTQLRTLVQRLQDKGGALSPVEQLFLDVHAQFPADIGCFCIFFLNRIELKPGEAMFLRANEIHAYLYGDCVEIMACSDNTVRAGLTPKFLDVETLCSMLDYTPGPAHSKVFSGRHDDRDPHATVYDPPIEDFSLFKIKVPEGALYTLPPLDSGSILLVVSGSARCPGRDDITLRRGSVLFLSANHGLPLAVTSSGELELFRAACLL